MSAAVSAAVSAAAMRARMAAAAEELAGVAGRIDPAGLEALAGRIAAAGRIVVAGCGRERLMLMALAMRLAHLGLAAAVQGETTAPPVGPGDLLLASAGPGDLPTVTALMARARAAGAEVALLTAEPDRVAPLADLVVTVPAQTMASDTGPRASSALPMGSLYEGALFLLSEALVLELADRLGVARAAMRARHTNLE